MTKSANRKSKIRAAAAKDGTNYTSALRRRDALHGPPGSPRQVLSMGPSEPPSFLLGDAVSVGPADSTTAVEWSPNSQTSRLLVDNTVGGSGPLERVLLMRAAAARLPTLAIGPAPDAYRAAHPRANVFGASNENVGYHAAPAAAAALKDFLSRADWRLLFVHLELPVEDEHGHPVAWESDFGDLHRMSVDEIRSLDWIVQSVTRLGSEPLPPGLIVIAVLSDVDLAHRFPATSFTTVISSALVLEYQHTATFGSALAEPTTYLPHLETQLRRLESQRARGAFWSGMNPKAGRIVLASIEGGPTRAVLISDPPDPESWWWPTREVILRNHDRFTTRGEGG